MYARSDSKSGFITVANRQLPSLLLQGEALLGVHRRRGADLLDQLAHQSGGAVGLARLPMEDAGAQRMATIGGTDSKLTGQGCLLLQAPQRHPQGALVRGGLLRQQA